MNLPGYGLGRPFIENMKERMTGTDKLFLMGIGMAVFAYLMLILSRTNSIKLLIFIVACYLIAKTGEFTSKKKDEAIYDENLSR